MYYSKKWGYINKVYNQSYRGKLIKQVLSKKISKNNIYYWATLMLPILMLIPIVILIFYFNLSRGWSMVLAIMSMLPMINIDSKLSKDFKELYDDFGILDQPFLKKNRMVSYALFNRKLTEDKLVTNEIIDNLLAWIDTDNSKFTIFKQFFEHKWVIIIITSIAGLAYTQFKIPNMNSKELLALSFIVFFLLFVTLIIFDFLNMTKKRNHEICRFLQFYKIDLTTRKSS